MEKYIINNCILLALLLLLTTFIQFPVTKGTGSCPENFSKYPGSILQTESNSLVKNSGFADHGILFPEKIQRQSFYRPASMTITIMLEKIK